MPVTLALDIGDKRIGAALSDPLGMLASPLTTLERARDADTIAEIRRLVAERRVETIVVGLPKMLNDTIGIQAEKVLAFERKLRATVSVPVVLWDERLTTVEAARLLRPPENPGRRSKVSKKRQAYIKENVDRIAATLLLESYLARTRQPT